MANWTKRISVATRLICAIALMMVGFAHKPLAADSVPAQFAAYVLPDGTLPTLCLNDDSTQPVKGVIHDHGCDACRIAATVLVPDQPAVDAQAIEFATVVRTAERQYRVARALYPPSSGPRAPPSSVILA